MNRKEQKAMKKEEKLQDKYRKIADGGRFKQWRHRRPFWGATLMILAGLLILYIPLQLFAIAFVQGSFVFVGFMFGGLMIIMGILDYIYPQFSTVFGIVGIFLAVLSVMGALGGFIIGTIIGIIGGALSIAWQKEEVTLPKKTSDEMNRETSKKPEPEVAQV
ncbi:DUF6114 domain-containing protein [Virgibacillus siamensis]|uniref:DUF6114 domain-containing protein n=1 Tax=Virgibacillus siamensis TaxID=480071 RepID=UPI000986A2C7|nr:DUF6114 domain-containing protein [Virgibacillus siamensis]